MLATRSAAPGIAVRVARLGRRETGAGIRRSHRFGAIAIALVVLPSLAPSVLYAGSIANLMERSIGPAFDGSALLPGLRTLVAQAK
jgi:hypothetical protein